LTSFVTEKGYRAEKVADAVMVAADDVS